MLIAGGLFAGASAAFAWSRVPIWRGMSVPDFVADFGETIRRTDIVQPGLAVVAAVAGIGFALTEEGSARAIAAVGAAGLIIVLVASVAVMVPLQRRIITTRGQVDDIEAMQRRWFSGNLGRSLLSVISFALLVVATTV